MSETASSIPGSEKAVFLEALDRTDPQARARFLEAACQGDSALRDRVERLLAQHHGSPSMLDTVAGLAPPAAAADVLERPGTRVGRYKLLQEIGEGGCGTVFMAEQEEPVRRRVALKVIKLGMDTKSVVARFEAERQALAMMDHPHIAKVLDGGATSTGRPYFVMELVRGVPITQFCDEQKLGLEARIDLFLMVCRAIQHAHQKGIIHRDIKPSNILVGLQDGKPMPKVIDFGIAKATGARLTDLTVFTAFDQVIGTPAYMSPEQAGLGGLDIDTRSDVYAMGVLLYELITGRTPFDARELVKIGLDEILRHIREVEAPRPSTRLSTLSRDLLASTASRQGADPVRLASFVRGDLDWIVMKCLEKDRARRYETVSDLAADLHRHLNYEPVTAGPPDARYRLEKAFRRHRSAFAMAAAVLFVLLAATLFSAWKARQANRSALLANAARLDAEDISAFMIDVLRSPDPDRRGRRITVAETLDRAAARLETELESQPVRRALFQSALADTYFGLGLYREAVALREKVVRHHQSVNGPEHTNTLTAMRDLAIAFSMTGQRADAIRIQDEVLLVRARLQGRGHPDTLASMVDLATQILCCQNRDDEALLLLEEAVAGLRQVSPAGDPAAEFASRVLQAQQVRLQRLDLGQMLASWEAYADRLQRDRGPRHPETIFALKDLAMGLAQYGQDAKAADLFQEALQRARSTLGMQHPVTMNALHESARCLARLGRHLEALALLEEALPNSLEVRGEDSPASVELSLDLADLCLKLDRPADAVRHGESLLTSVRRHFPKDHLAQRNARIQLAAAYDRIPDRTADGIRLLEETVQFDRQFRRTGTNYLDSMALLASAYRRAGRPRDEIPVLEEMLEIRRKTSRRDSPKTFLVISNLTQACLAVGRTNEALSLENELAELQADAARQPAPDSPRQQVHAYIPPFSTLRR